MNDEAREALGRVIHTYGPSICHTPRSCELFVRQECAAYPDETRVLVEALRHGVTTELFRYQPAEKPWESFTNDMRRQLQSRCKLNDTEWKWAIDTWARVLGRHPAAWHAAPDVMPGIPSTLPKGPSRGALVTVTTIIVGAGGALGGALGSILVPAGLLVTQASVDMPFMKEAVRRGASKDVWMIVAVILLAVGLIGALGGGLGAALGWLHGKGDSKPWAGFGVACGAAFTTAALSGHFCSIFGWFAGSFLSAFAAARSCASRGGFS